MILWITVHITYVSQKAFTIQYEYKDMLRQQTNNKINKGHIEDHIDSNNRQVSIQSA